MQERILIIDAVAQVGQVVRVCGWVETRRDHGKLIFLDVRDRSALLQCVVLPDAQEASDMAKELRSEYVVELVGLIKERPKNAQKDVPAGSIEMEVKEIRILAKPSEELPVDISQKEMGLQLDTLLNYRHLTLRNEKVRAIFQLYAKLLKAYAEHMRLKGFLEIKSPKILESATEGGANFFKVHYFDREAFLAQSPQFYKQAGVSIFERVFEIGSVFRAEPHFTTRHVNEYVGLDAELGFIESVDDVMDALEEVIVAIMESFALSENAGFLALHEATVPDMVKIPRIRLDEATIILKEEYDKELEDMDIDAEGERMIGDYVKKKYKSDFVFLTHYPKSLRPFYTLPSKDGKYTESFDLIFRGLEIATGGQRIHSYNQLVESIQAKGLNPQDFSSYLDIFKYGIPPHGGWGLGSERIIQQLLGLKSIKEAVLYPRDVKRLEP